MNLTADQWTEIWRFFPLLLATLAVLYGGWKERPWWVYGGTFRDAISERDKQIAALTKERDQMRDLLIQNLTTTRASLESAATLLRPGGPASPPGPPAP